MSICRRFFLGVKSRIIQDLIGGGDYDIYKHRPVTIKIRSKEEVVDENLLSLIPYVGYNQIADGVELDIVDGTSFGIGSIDGTERWYTVDEYHLQPIEPITDYKTSVTIIIPLRDPNMDKGIKHG